MDVRVETASVAGFAVAGGGNGIGVTAFSWTKTPRTQRRSRPRAHGSKDLSRYYEGRLYHLAGVLYGVSEEDAQARLDSFEEAIALDGDYVALQWRLAGRTDDETALVKVDGDLAYEFANDTRTALRWALTLFAEDPRRYGATERTGTYDPTAAGSGAGIVFAEVFPLNFAGTSSTHLDVTNAGNFPTPPVLTITGPVTNPIIDNDTTGESITTSGLALLADETAVIDVAAKTITVGGSLRPDLIDASATDWFELAKGSNLLRLRGTGMVTSETALAVSFHDARI